MYVCFAQGGIAKLNCACNLYIYIFLFNILDLNEMETHFFNEKI